MKNTQLYSTKIFVKYFSFIIIQFVISFSSPTKKDRYEKLYPSEKDATPMDERVSINDVGKSMDHLNEMPYWIKPYTNKMMNDKRRAKMLKEETGTNGLYINYFS